MKNFLMPMAMGLVLSTAAACALAAVPVGSFQPNAFGLHDMIGNAWEWAGDCWNATLAGAPADGATRNGDCSRRMVRGASWQSYPGLARSAMRVRAEPDNRSADYGFRVVRGN